MEGLGPKGREEAGEFLAQVRVETLLHFVSIPRCLCNKANLVKGKSCVDA